MGVSGPSLLIESTDYDYYMYICKSNFCTLKLIIDTIIIIALLCMVSELFAVMNNFDYNYYNLAYSCSLPTD